MIKLIIPNDWEEVKLGEICDLKIGGTPSRSRKEYWDKLKETNNLWVSIRDLKQKNINETKEYISELGVKKSNVKLIKQGTLIMSFKLSVGKVAFAGQNLYTNEAIVGLEPLDENKVSNLFLYYVIPFINPLSYCDSTIKGNSLNKEKIKIISIPLPSLKEQNNIIKILINVDNQIEKTQEIIAKTEEIKQGLMQELLVKGISHKEFKEVELRGKLINIPKFWKFEKIEQFLKTSAGGTPSRAKKIYYTGNIPWLKSGELNNKYIIDTVEQITEDAINNSSAKLFPINTILIAMYGATVGKLSILKIDASTNQAICGLLPNDNYNTNFLFYMMSILKNDLIRQGKGGAQPNISQDIIRNTKVPFPPLKEQEQIANILSNVDNSITKEKNYLNELQETKKGLIQDLLSGRVRFKTN